MANLWIEGGSCSGKSSKAIAQLCTWVETEIADQANPQAAAQSILVFCVDSDQRQIFSDRFTKQTQGKYPITLTTATSFYREAVLLFWPLLVKTLDLKAQFPIILRVEKEQELAAQLWQDAIEQGLLQMPGASRARLVRYLLDLYLLAVNSGTPIADVPQILMQGLPQSMVNPSPEEQGNSFSPDAWQYVGKALLEWRQFCWRNNLLTYGITAELFHRHLLPHPYYREKLIHTYRYVVVDDADEYPAIACDLCDALISNGAQSVFTFNPQGSIRLGLGADPSYWQQNLKQHCAVIELPQNSDNSLGAAITPTVLDVVLESGMRFLPSYSAEEPISAFHTIETISRAKLLRLVGETIAAAVASGQISSGEIAVIAPGLDDIAKYALTEILRGKQIAVTPLNEQRPLSLSAPVRALLALVTLIYPNLGHLVGRDEIAEMLTTLVAEIDPVRAGILADRCFVPHPNQPHLLDCQIYEEWHRLGYEASVAYEKFKNWIASQSPALTPLLLLDRAIHKFLIPTNPSFEKLSALQELIETAQHYWQVSYRLGWQEQKIMQNFIQLIRQGTTTANPYTSRSQLLSTISNSVTLATIYQYRMARLQHRWQFWLDVGSPLWQSGGAAVLFGAPLFLHSWNGKARTPQDEMNDDQRRLENVLTDLLNRTSERVHLCFSELNTSGQLQVGPLSALVDIAVSQ